MPIHNQLRIVDPQDKFKIYDLDEERDVTTVGQDPTSDILVQGAGTAPVQFELDYRQEPYCLTVAAGAAAVTVNGVLVPSGGSYELHDRDVIRVAGYTMTFRTAEEEPEEEPEPLPESEPRPEPVPVEPADGDKETPPPEPEPDPPAPQEEAPAPTEPEEPAILTELSVPALTLDVEQIAILQLVVTNAGDLVADFQVKAEGDAAGWVTLSPAEFHLNEREQQTVDVSIRAPRSPASRAGAHRLTLVTISPTYPRQRDDKTASITVTPYYELGVGLSPRKVKIPWSEPAGRTEVPLSNKGNSDVVVVLAAEDDAHACRFQFEIPAGMEDETLVLTKEVDLRVPVEQTVRLPVQLIPQGRPLIGRGGRLIDTKPLIHPFTVSVSMAQGQPVPWTLAGEWENTPRFSRRVLVASVLVLILLFLIIFLPGITEYDLSADPDSIRAGQVVELDWMSRPLIGFRLNGQAAKPPVYLRPEQTTTYELRAETWLSRLLPFLASNDEVKVVVRPVKPDILLFEAEPDRAMPGESVVLSWVVDDAREVILVDQAAGTQETLSSPCGSREIQVGQEGARYSLQAIAADGTDVERVVTVQVGSPLIRVFSAKPQAITTPTRVELAWWALGPRQEITIKSRGIKESSGKVLMTTALPRGIVTTGPLANTTVFTVSVGSGTGQVVQTARVPFVRPTPGATPTPIQTSVTAAAATLTATPTPIPGRVIVYTALDEKEVTLLGATPIAARDDLPKGLGRPDLSLEELQKRYFNLVLTPANAPALNVLIVRESTQDLIRRLLSERENPQADVVWMTAATGTIRLRAEGLLEPLAGLNEPQGMDRLKEGWRDPSTPPQWLGLGAWVAALCVNEDKLERVGTPQSWADLTKPVYEGLIAMPSPKHSGTGYMVVSGWLQMFPFGEPVGWEYMDRLHENIAWYTDSGSEPSKLAAGDSTIAVGVCAASIFASDAVRTVFPADGSPWEMDTVALVRKDRIGEGARAFMEWAISDEAMRGYARFRPVSAYEGFNPETILFPDFREDMLIPNRFLWASANYERIAEKWLGRYAGEENPVLLQAGQ